MMRFQSLADWLGWLEQNHPSEIELGLERIGRVAETLGLLQVFNRDRSAKVISVAGTNGKGSCAAVLESALIASGHSVGVFTSPHFLHYCERIRVDAAPVAEGEVCEAFARIDDACRVLDISLTYFEYGTLAALEVFRHRTVDYLVLEVGLGGRLDAVNLIDADVALVTSIAIDHEEWLGSDREVIGREKAGIFRPDRIAISADPEPPASIAQAARSCEARLFQAGETWGYQAENSEWSWWGQGSDGEPLMRLEHLPAPSLPLPSVAAALQALTGLDIELSSRWLHHTLPSLSLPGRFQQLVYRERNWVLDVAHNPAAAEFLSVRLHRQPVVGQTLAVVAMMADKDCEASFAAMQPQVNHWTVAGLPDLPRAATPVQLQSHLQSLGIEAAACDTVAQALASAVKRSVPGDRIVVMGSFFTVAAALEWMALGA